MRKILFILITIGLTSTITFCQSNEIYNVGQQTLEFKDLIRNRPLKTEIWYPTMDSLSEKSYITDYPFILNPAVRNANTINKKFPLIMLSHGTGGNRISLMWLAYELAKNGFFVAAVDHWGNTFDNKIPENFVKIWDRPLDISFVITELLKDSSYFNIIDKNKVGVAGFSLGGYTTIALAGGNIDYNALKEFSETSEGKIEFRIPGLGDVSNLITKELIEEGITGYPSLKDNRIKAFFAMAPAIGQGFIKENQFETIQSHVLIIGVIGDKRAPIKTNALHYHLLIKESGYYQINGKAGHYVFMNVAKDELKRNARRIFKDHKSVDRGLIHRDIAKMAIGYFKEELNQ